MFLGRGSARNTGIHRSNKTRTVLYPGKGKCADPVNEDAILKVDGGGGPQSQNRERQLASDSGGDKT
jgi:hypothetical protein